LNRRIEACTRCPRLIAHCRKVAAEKKRAHRDQIYWGRPVPSFGDPEARLLIVGLAPGAHGSNRTGRMFTGDASGEWLFEALHRFGFASRAASVARDDGLKLTDAWITAVNHCAPPGNKPTPEEQDLCRPYLVRELMILDRVEVILALGRIAFEGVLKALEALGIVGFRPRPAFGPEAEFMPDSPGGPVILCSYHPSRQNTNTGRLTRPMFHSRLRRVRALLDRESGSLRGSAGP
jgi:uracil-DNA glycosylase family 4